MYEKKHYRQTVGGTMGSAVTSMLANIFMRKCKKDNLLNDCKHQMKFIVDN